jgi:DNA polymerase delta subunit 3
MDTDEPMTDSQDAPTEDKETPEASTSQEAQKIEPEEPTVVVQGGRRRGRRQVKKKMTVKDEEGYLVTKEELVWESFSEDEPAPPKPKSSGFTSSGASKAGKSGAKGTQGKGNIMSFFSKK